MKFKVGDVVTDRFKSLYTIIEIKDGMYKYRYNTLDGTREDWMDFDDFEKYDETRLLTPLEQLL
jgi:hypothetical protein